MRCRVRIPKIYRRGAWFCFRITDSQGRRIEVRAITRQQAQQQLMDMLSQVLTAVGHQPSSYRISFQQAADHWLSSKDGIIAQSSFLRYQRYLTNFKAFLGIKYPGLRYVDEINSELIREYMLYRLNDQGKAPKTINSEKQVLGNLFQLLIDQQKLPGNNPAEKVALLKVTKVQNRRALTDEELYKLLQAAKQEKGKIDWHGILLTLYMTGMRRNELRLLEKRHVDLVGGKIVVLQTKTNNSKWIPIHPQLRETLEKALKESQGNYVFPNERGGVLLKNKIRDKMIQLCRKAGISRATVHDLRHTFASHHGLSYDTKQRIGGWSSQNVMQKTYIHVPDQRIVAEYCQSNFLPEPPAQELTSP